MIPNRPPDLRLILPSPPSVNAAYNNRRKGRYKAPEYVKWIQAVNHLFTTKYKNLINLIRPPYAVVYSFNKTDERKRDCANYEKCLSDMFVKLGIIEDDSKINVNAQRWVMLPHKERVVICDIYSEVKISNYNDTLYSLQGDSNHERQGRQEKRSFHKGGRNVL